MLYSCSLRPVQLFRFTTALKADFIISSAESHNHLVTQTSLESATFQRYISPPFPKLRAACTPKCTLMLCQRAFCTDKSHVKMTILRLLNTPIPQLALIFIRHRMKALSNVTSTRFRSKSHYSFSTTPPTRSKCN